MSSSLIGSLLKLESQLQCDLCHNLVNDARTLNECGHRFCRGCVYDRIGVERTCPTCHLPAIVKNLRPDPMHDTLVACVRKLGTLLVGGTPSVDTHGLLSENNSMEQAGDPMHRHRLQESSGLLQMARDTSNDKGTTRSEWMDSQPQNDTDRSLSGTKMYETSPISLLQPVQEFPSMSPHMPQTPSEMEDQTMSDEKHVPTHSAVADTLMETKTLSAVEQQRGAEEKVKDLTVGHDVFSSSVSSVSTTDAMLPSWLRDQLRNSVPPLNEDDAMSRPSLDSVGSESETVPLLRDWLRRSDSSDLVRFHRPAKGIIASVTRTPSPLQIDEGDLSPHGNDDDVDDTMSCDEQVTNGSEIGSSVATGQQTPSLLRDYLAAPFDYDEEEDTIMQEQPKEDPTPNNVQNTTNTADSHDHVSNKIKTPSTIPSSSKHDEQQQQQQYHPHSHFVNNNGINTTTTTPTQHSINHCNNYIGIQHQHEQQQQPPTATTAVVENDNNETDDNERYSAEALLKELDQSSLPDDELSFPEDERLPPPSNRTIAQVPVAVQPITHEEDDNNNDDNMSLLLQELLKDDGLPDDEIPSTSEKGKRKQSEKRKSIDRSNASSKAPISLPSPATTEEAVAPEALAETDIFSIDVPHPYSKRLRLSDPNDHSGSRIARNNNHPAQPSAAAATAADQQEQQQGPSITAAKEPWQCLHCQYMNPVTVETCGLCRKMRGSAPAVTISQSISSTPMTVTASVIPTSQEEQDYLAATRMRTFDAVRVMFTGIKTDEAQAVLDKFGESELTLSPVNDDVDDIPRHVDDVTHIVTKGNEQGLSGRTVKYLWGILAGKWVVDVTWLIDSCNEGRWLPEAPYEIVGDTVMGLTHGPRKGRRRLEKQECPLFHAMRFNFFDKTHPKRDKLMKLCQQVGGGEVLSRRPPADKAGPWRDNDNVQRRSVHRNVPIIIVTDQRQLKKKSAKPLELYQVRDARWLLDCISRCDVVEAN